MERLIRVEVTKLFGYLNHVIAIDNENGVTVLHGANGSGKTTILRAISECSRQVPYSLLKIPFEQFEFTFESGSRLALRRFSELKGEISLSSKKSTTKWKFESPSVDSRDMTQFILQHNKHHQLFFDQWSEVENLAASERERLALNPALFTRGFLKKDPPQWLQEFWKTFWVTLIEEQRLIKLEAEKKRPQFTRVVTDFSERIKALIRDVQREYGKRSQQLERSYLARAVTALATNPPDVSDVQTKFAEVERRRNSLTSAGLLEPEEEALPFDSERLSNRDVRCLLSLYANDTWSKLQLFDDVFARIDLLETLLNEYFSHKRVHLSRNGIEIFTDGDDQLPAEALSSGEQHVLVLFFSLIFNTDERSHLVLIDEPELSLHPRWQIRFIDDLEKIRELSPTNFVLASHSPLILQGHSDLARNLEV